MKKIVISSFLTLLCLITLGQSTYSNKNKGQQNNNTGPGIQNIYNKTTIKTPKSKYEKILITPKRITILPHMVSDRVIVITNNLPYPVFGVLVDFEVKKGNFDLTKSITPFSNGIFSPKYVSNAIDKIDARQSITITWHIDGSQYGTTSKVNLSVPEYFDQSFPNNFTIPVKGDTAPSKIYVGGDFIPKPKKNN